MSRLLPLINCVSYQSHSTINDSRTNHSPTQTHTKYFQLPHKQLQIHKNLGIKNSTPASGIICKLYDYICRIVNWYVYSNNSLHYDAMHSNFVNINSNNVNLINEVNCYGETPLMLAIKKTCTTQDECLKIKDKILSLTKNGANIHIKDKFCMNALLHAANNHKLDDIVKFLVEIGADPKSCDYKNNNGIHFASKNGSLNILKFFHQYLPIDVYNKDELSPLMLAAINVFNVAEPGMDTLYLDKNQLDYVDVVKYLVSFGASITEKNKNKFTAFDASLIGKNDKIIKIFLDQCHDNNTSTLLVDAKKNQATKLFEKIVLDPNTVYESIMDKNGWSHFDVTVDGIQMPLLDILRNVQWNMVSFSEEEYNKLILSPRINAGVSNVDISQSINIRVSLEPEDTREELRIKLEKNYEKLTNIEIYMLRSYTGMLSRFIGEVMSGNKCPRDVSCEYIIPRIGIIVNALNKMEPEHHDYVYRGQADIYKQNKHNSPLFLSASKVYDVAQVYSKHGQVVEYEGRGAGHVVFLKNVIGYDISGLSTVPSAKEIITLPSLIKYYDNDYLKYDPETSYHKSDQSVPYYFGSLYNRPYFQKSSL